MTASTLFEKHLKRDLYGKPQTVIATFPAGLGAPALAEVRAILASLWFQPKSVGEVSLDKSLIQIENTHLFAVTELMLRSQCLTDVRLILTAGKTGSKFAFEKKCRDVRWDYYLRPGMTVKLKVNSIASHAFHEASLKTILRTIMQEASVHVVSGEATDADTTIHAELYQDRLTLSISLAGESLYKRGYRGVLSASAPLREDAAASCLDLARAFALEQAADFAPATMLVPFSGTGTFVFEEAMHLTGIAPALFRADYAIQKMPLYRADNFQHLLKQAKAHTVTTTTQFICIDSSSAANAALQDNADRFNAVLTAQGLAALDLQLQADNFLQMESLPLTGDVLVPLNPPYGIRLGKQNDATALYRQIATTLKTWASGAGCRLGGFIFCPTEETWSTFQRALTGAKTQTYHFTQGGLDIRVCQFFV